MQRFRATSLGVTRYAEKRDARASASHAVLCSLACTVAAHPGLGGIGVANEGGGGGGGGEGGEGEGGGGQDGGGGSSALPVL